MTVAPAIAFRYRPSRVLIAATAVVALLAVLAIWSSAGPLSLRFVLALAVVAWAGAALGRLLRPRVHSLAWHAAGGVDLVLGATAGGAGREAQGGIQAARVLGPLLVLTVRWPPRERAHLWILPDNLDADTRRRLRVRLGTHRRGLSSGNADSR